MKLVVMGVWVGLAAVAVAGTGSLAAQQGGNPKIAFVNTQAILKQTPGYVKAESTFTKELATYRVEVQKLQASLDSSASDFDQQSVMLSPTQRAAKRKDLQAQQQKLEQRTQELQQRAALGEWAELRRLLVCPMEPPSRQNCVTMVSTRIASPMVIVTSRRPFKAALVEMKISES